MVTLGIGCRGLAFSLPAPCLCMPVPMPRCFLWDFPPHKRNSLISAGLHLDIRWKSIYDIFDFWGRELWRLYHLTSLDLQKWTWPFQVFSHCLNREGILQYHGSHTPSTYGGLLSTLLIGWGRWMKKLVRPHGLLVLVERAIIYYSFSPAITQRTGTIDNQYRLAHSPTRPPVADETTRVSESVPQQSNETWAVNRPPYFIHPNHMVHGPAADSPFLFFVVYELAARQQTIYDCSRL